MPSSSLEPRLMLSNELNTRGERHHSQTPQPRRTCQIVRERWQEAAPEGLLCKATLKSTAATAAGPAVEN
jgi:hypothetical protein